MLGIFCDTVLRAVTWGPRAAGGREGVVGARGRGEAACAAGREKEHGGQTRDETQRG